ncbi:MAG: hypothetical protein ACHQII_04750 [Bacteroidia bacterium]
MLGWCREKFGQNALWPVQLKNSDRYRWYACNAKMTAESLMASFTFKSDADSTVFGLQWSDHQ